MKDSDPKLKPCPLCGSSVGFINVPVGGTGSSGMEEPDVMIECGKCGIKTRRLPQERWVQGRGTFSIRSESRLKLAEVWNARTKEANDD